MTERARGETPPGVHLQAHLHAGSLGSISIALIDDNRVVLEGLMALLNQVPELKVVYSGSGADLAELERVNPRVVLLDLGLENGDSLSAARTVGEALPESRVVVMDLLPAQEDIKDLVEAGVSGFILKDATLDELVTTIRSVAAGAHVLPSTVANSLFSQIATGAFASRGQEAVDAVRMTPREREVIDLISEGLSNKSISARLGISVHTVKSHIRNIMEKLALHTRLQLAAWAHQEEDEKQE
jgi:DNA-binding NarL/FixJ family response regulator